MRFLFSDFRFLLGCIVYEQMVCFFFKIVIQFLNIFGILMTIQNHYLMSAFYIYSFIFTNQIFFTVYLFCFLK